MNLQTKKIEHSLDAKIIEAAKENRKRLGDIEHRLEYVDTFDGVEYINDAKATDINSTWYSIDCLAQPLIWIAESSSDVEDLELYREIEMDHVKAIIISGSNPDPLMEILSEKVELLGKVNTIYEAVEQASHIATEGDMVLYSPSCSDFDNYKSFKERGQLFRKAVREIQL